MTENTFGSFGGGGAWAPGYSRLTFSGVYGTLASPFERWAFRFHLNAGGSKAQNDALATAAATAFSANLVNQMANVARLTEVKVATLDDNGRYESDPSILAADVPGGGVATNFRLPQYALAVSLTTERRGPTGKGRFYLPVPNAVPQSTDGLIPVAARDSLATASAAFINAINANAHPGSVCIVSSKGYSSVVNGVRVGRRPDVIRSRAGQIAESYSGIAAVTA